jgi:hypothetical protein
MNDFHLPPLYEEGTRMLYVYTDGEYGGSFYDFGEATVSVDKFFATGRCAIVTVETETGGADPTFTVCYTRSRP